MGRFDRLIHSKGFNQTGLLLLATISNIITQIVINALLTRTISQEEYGNYSYFINLFTFCQTGFNFGFFYTICRIISTANDEEEIRKYYFEGLKYWVITSVVMVVSLYVFSIVELQELRRNHIEKTFWLIIPFGCVYLATNYNEQIFQGNNRISELAVSRAVPKFLYAFVLVASFLLNRKYTILVYLILYMCSHLLVYSYLIKRMRPISGAEGKFREIYIKNKGFGLNIYFGSLLSVGVASLMGLLISKFCINNIELGYYNIALQITVPLTLIPNILSTVLFKRFTDSSDISKKTILAVIVISVILYLGLFIFSNLIISIVFGEGYLPAAKLIKILGLGSVLYGIADFYNRYILAQGRAVIIRNIATAVGITYLILGLMMIPHYFAVGASYARVITGILYLGLEAGCAHFYLKKHN